MPVIVVTCREKCEETGRTVTLVSHGYDVDTGKRVILPCEEVWKFERCPGVRRDPVHGLVIDSTPQAARQR